MQERHFIFDIDGTLINTEKAGAVIFLSGNPGEPGSGTAGD